MREVLGGMPSLDWADSASAPEPQTPVPARYEQLFQVGRAVNGFPPIAGNRARLLADSNAAIDAIVSDIEAAQRTVHVLFSIWLVDNNGLKVVEALRRAAARGVACRAMLDGLGSRSMIGSIHWESLRASGVHVATAMPIGNPVMRGLFGRIDLRNHRKIVVIDGTITYCGSQNCSDPEFRIKPRYAPWVDAMVRFEGPIARQNQHLFVSDWMAQIDEDIRGLLTEPLGPVLEEGLTAQVIGTGPTMGYSAMPEVFESLAFAARLPPDLSHCRFARLLLSYRHKDTLLGDEIPAMCLLV